jgi:hypothetical protein
MQLARASWPPSGMPTQASRLLHCTSASRACWACRQCARQWRRLDTQRRAPSVPSLKNIPTILATCILFTKSACLLPSPFSGVDFVRHVESCESFFNLDGLISRVINAGLVSPTDVQPTLPPHAGHFCWPLKMSLWGLRSRPKQHMHAHWRCKRSTAAFTITASAPSACRLLCAGV